MTEGASKILSGPFEDGSVREETGFSGPIGVYN